MSVIIDGKYKPKSCRSCEYNNSDLYCSITKGLIDRDDYSNDMLCPIHDAIEVIEPLDRMYQYLKERIGTIDDEDELVKFAVIDAGKYFENQRRNKRDSE